MAKTIGCPPCFYLVAKLLVQVIHAYRILIKDVIIIGYCFIVLNPPSVGNFQLSVFEELFNLLFVFGGSVFVPIPEKEYLGDKIFPIGGWLE